jgi:hypothetical protein
MHQARGVSGGYDAGGQMIPVWSAYGVHSPIAPATCQIELDGVNEAEFLGLTSMVPLGIPRFSVQDEMVLPDKTGKHESSHAIIKVLIASLMAMNSWTEDVAKDYVYTILWLARFAGSMAPATWQEQQAVSAGYTGQQAWMNDVGEMWAECYACVVSGDLYQESTMNYGWPLDRVKMRQTLDDLMNECGGVVVMKQLDFYLTLVNGVANTIGNAITEAERVLLGLVPGRKYTADCHRIWLNGSETTLPDVEVGAAEVYEDTAVPLGQSGRFKFSVFVRRDFGGQGRYALRIAPRTAYVSRG